MSRKSLFKTNTDYILQYTVSIANVYLTSILQRNQIFWNLKISSIFRVFKTGLIELRHFWRRIEGNHACVSMDPLVWQLFPRNRSLDFSETYYKWKKVTAYYLEKFLFLYILRKNGLTRIKEDTFVFFSDFGAPFFYLFVCLFKHEGTRVWVLKGSVYCFVSETLVGPKLK